MKNALQLMTEHEYVFSRLINFYGFKTKEAKILAQQLHFSWHILFIQDIKM